MNKLQRILATVLALSVLATLLVSCKDADKKESSSEDTAVEASDSTADTSDDTREDSSYVQSSEQSSADGQSAASSEVEASSAPSSSAPDDSSTTSKAPESSSTAPDTSSAAPDTSSTAPDNSSTAPSTSSTAPDTGSTAPDTSSTAPVTSKDDSSAQTSSAPDSSVPDSSVFESSAPVSSMPDSSAPASSAPISSILPDSSEEEISVDPYSPLNPLPEKLYADPIDSFFDNSVFLGYSIMMHFGRYVQQWRQEIDSSIMGDALFCAGVGISFHADATQTPDTPDTTLPLFRGRPYNFADLPIATGSDTLYIGLMVYSDLKWAGSSSTAATEAYAATVQGIRRIQAKNPNLNIVLLSGTYNSGIYQGLSKKWQSNDKVMEYNNLVINYCNKNGIDFIDVATPLVDHRGYFVADYATDGEYHIQKQAYYLWMEQLRDYATRKKNGTWQNITQMPTF